MTSSSTVGTGRRYRLTAIGREAMKAALDADVLGPGDAWIPSDLTEPVGLDMAEPDNGTVVLVSWRVEIDGSTRQMVAQRRDFEAPNVWRSIGNGSWTWSRFCALPGVSITVLVPRDDDLRERVAAARATAAEKATNLTERTPIGAVHAYYRDVFADLLGESGWSINGRRPQADDGE